jgi:hypothetical protein
LSAELLGHHLKDEAIDHEAEYRFGAIASGGAGKGLRGRLKEAGLKDWRADFHIIGHMLLVEVEGGAWTGGRHTTGVGFNADLAKYDAAMRLGYSVYRCSPEMVKKGHAIETIKQLIALRLADQ